MPSVGEGVQFQADLDTVIALNDEKHRLVHVNRSEGCIFLHCPVAVWYRKYLRFCPQGECYQYTFLPFAYRLSPISFSRCVKSALCVVLRENLQVAWMDDLLVVAKSPELAVDHSVVD